MELFYLSSKQTCDSLVGIRLFVEIERIPNWIPFK